MAMQEIKIADKETLDEVKSLLENMKNTQVVELEAVGETVDDKLSITELVNLTTSFEIVDVIVFNDELHIFCEEANTIGGACYHYKTNGSTWIEVGMLPCDADNSWIEIYNNEIHVLKGTQHYKFDGSTWAEVGTLPCRISYTVNELVIVCKEEIHVLEGTQHYKFDGSTWAEVGTLPYEVDAHTCVVVYNNEIHMLGSYEGTQHYKFDGSTWTNVCTLPYPVSGTSFVVYNNEIHMFSSDDRTYAYQYYKKHYKFNGSTWTNVCTLPRMLTGGVVIIYENEIHYFSSDTPSFYDQHCKFNGSTWTDAGELPFDLYDKGNVVLYNDEIYFFVSDIGYYKLYRKIYKQLPTIHLPKDTNIYSPNELTDILNCTLDTDHLVVTEDGNVSFGVLTEDTKSLITLC